MSIKWGVRRKAIKDFTEEVSKGHREDLCSHGNKELQERERYSPVYVLKDALTAE